MSDQLSVMELMKAYGYVLKGTCNCDGYETIKFKKDHREIKWRKYKYQFQIFEGRIALNNWTSVLQLPEQLKKIHPDVAISKQKA